MSRITSYHVFADYKDEWTSTRKQAEEVYRQWRDEGHNNIRIYKCISDTDYPQDETEEQYIKGRGDFPW